MKRVTYLIWPLPPTMSLVVKRVFHPLGIAPLGTLCASFNLFLVERFAYVQRNAMRDGRQSFDAGPFIEAMPAKDETNS